jgi:ArsR family transcriptional regulator
VVEALGIAQPSASKAFRALKEAGLVTDRRSANWTYYRVNEDMPGWMADIVRATIDAIAESDAYQAVDGNFQRLATRERSAC